MCIAEVWSIESLFLISVVDSTEFTIDGVEFVSVGVGSGVVLTLCELGGRYFPRLRLVLFCVLGLLIDVANVGLVDTFAGPVDERRSGICGGRLGNRA